jgi:hypothetical protein
MNIIDLSSTINNYGSSRAQEVLDEWKSIESSLNLPNKIKLTGALANPNSQESKDLIVKYNNGLVLESLYTDRFYEAIKNDKTINYLREFILSKAVSISYIFLKNDIPFVQQIIRVY